MKTEHFTGWTVADVMALRPCYSKENVIDVFDGRETLTMLDVCDLHVPARDKLWLLTRAPHDVIQPALEKVVARAVKQYALPCLETRGWAEQWLSGKDRSRAAAGAAARAAWAAARAAWAWVAAEEGAWAAAAEAARAAEQERQLADFRELAAVRAAIAKAKGQ